MPETSTFLGTLYGWLIIAVFTGLLALIAYGGRYLATKAKESKLAAFMQGLYDKAQSVVAHIDAEFRPKLVEALKDGVLTAKEKADLKEAALKLLLEQLGAEGLKQLDELKGIAGPAVGVYLSGLLERALGLQRAIAQTGVKKVQLRAGDIIATRVTPPF